MFTNTPRVTESRTVYNECAIFNGGFIRITSRHFTFPSLPFSSLPISLPFVLALPITPPISQQFETGK